MRYKKALLIMAVMGLLVMASPVAAQSNNVSVNESVDDNASVNDTVPDDDSSEMNESNESVGDGGNGVPLGLRIASVVASERSAVHGMLDRSRFNREFERNETGAINNRTGELQSRINEIKQRKEQIKEEYRNGNISEAEYQVQSASVESELNQLNESVNDTVDKAAGLDVAAENGVNVTAIRMLKESASDLGGQSVSQIARSIGGPPGDVGPDRRGPPTGVGGGEEGDENDSRGPPGDIGRGGDEDGSRGPPADVGGGDEDEDNDSQPLP